MVTKVCRHSRQRMIVVASQEEQGAGLTGEVVSYGCPWAHDSVWWWSAGHHPLQGCIVGRAPAGQSWRLGRADQAWCSGLSSAPGLLRRSVLSGYQRACWDELPSALLYGQSLLPLEVLLPSCHQKPRAPHWAPNVAGLWCMYVYKGLCPWRVRGKNMRRRRGTVAVYFKVVVLVALADWCSPSQFDKGSFFFQINNLYNWPLNLLLDHTCI